MKNFVCLLFLFFTIHFFAQKEESLLELNVHFYGEPIYVINPYSIKDNGILCTDSVLLNNAKVEIVNGSAYIIDFKKVNINFGDSVNIKIFHKKDCQPKPIVDYNPRKDLVSISKLEIDVNGKLEWEVSSQLFTSYKVEQFKWNRWVKIDEGMRIDDIKKYSLSLKPLYGSNQFKVVLMAVDGRYVEAKILIHSDRLEFGVKKVTIKSNCRDIGRNYIYFSDSTYYEVYDQYSNLIMKGYDNQIDYRKLKKGIYYFNYDSVTGEIFHKK